MTEEAIDFERADLPSEGNEVPTCPICSAAMGAQYFEIGNRISCVSCGVRVKGEHEASKSLRTFAKAWLHGTGVALLGAIIWGLVRMITGWELALLSIAIGIAVGVAIKKATKGHGGKRYQALAMFLTYSAIVITYVPAILEAAAKQPAAQQAQGAGSVQGVAPVQTVAPIPSANVDPAPQAPPGPPPTFGQFVIACVALLGLAYAMPFLMGFKNILGLLIIGIGMYEAWKFTKGEGVRIAGPFERR